MQRGLVWGFLALAGAGIGACTPEAEKEAAEPATSATTVVQAQKTAAGLKPVDLSSGVAGAKVKYAKKAPPLRKATQDEVEELNGTYRTEGSRDRLLRRIEVARPEHRDDLVGLYNTVAAKLPEADRNAAQAKLAQVMARVR
jgi:hypothetical protein